MSDIEARVENKILDGTFSGPLARDTITTTIWSSIGKAAGFLVPFFIAAWFGVTSETDAFFFAYGFVMLMTGVFAASIESVIVPFIAEIRAKDEREIGKFIGSILVLSIASLAIISAFFIAAAKPFFSFVTRFSSEEIRLLVLLLLEIVPLILLITLTSVLSGALNACRIFSLPAVSPAFRAAAAIVVIFLFKSKIGIHAIPLGYVIGEAFRFLILLGQIISRKLFSISFSLNLGPKIIEFFKTASFQSVCLVSGGLNYLIDKAMGSWLGEGSVTVLHYADRLYMIPANLMTAGFLPVILSYWSHHYSQENDKIELLQKVKNMARLSMWAGLFVFIIFLIFRGSLVHLAFARGKFPSAAIPSVERTFVSYLFGLMPFVTASVLVQAYLTLKKTSILMILGLFSLILNIILNFVLMQFLGLAGIALSTSITSLIIAVLLFKFLPK